MKKRAAKKVAAKVIWPDVKPVDEFQRRIALLRYIAMATEGYPFVDEEGDDVVTPPIHGEPCLRKLVVEGYVQWGKRLQGVRWAGSPVRDEIDVDPVIVYRLTPKGDGLIETMRETKWRPSE